MLESSWGRTKMCLDEKHLLYKWTKDTNEQHSLLNILSDSFSCRIESTEIRVWTAENTFVWIVVSLFTLGHQKFPVTKLSFYLSLSLILSLSLLAAALAGVITVRNDGAGAARPSCSLRSLLQLHTNTVLCLSTLKPTHIHVQITHTHTYLLNPHLPGHHMSSIPFMVSLYFSFSLEGALFTCRCQCDCLQRGGKAWPFLSHSFYVPHCTLTLHLSCSTEEHRGKRPDKGGKHWARNSKLW